MAEGNSTTEAEVSTLQGGHHSPGDIITANEQNMTEGEASSESITREGTNGTTLNGIIKRKREDDKSSTNHSSAIQSADNSTKDYSSEADFKRIKLSNTGNGQENGISVTTSELLVSRLAISLWQRVFSFVPPVFLGRLMRVNHVFHSMLSSGKINGEDFSTVSENIWKSSHRRFTPGLPKPAVGQTELEMWRLLRGNTCQFCGVKKLLSTSSGTEDPASAGPGSDNLRVIWPFSVRSCGDCLVNNTEKVSSP
jgi:hypothetical protein